MKEIVELMVSEDDVYYFNLQKENFIKSFRYKKGRSIRIRIETNQGL